MKQVLKELKRIIRREPPMTKGTIGEWEIATLINRQDPTILEIGSHHGCHTLQFLKLFPRASIYCFEPDPRARRIFRQRVTSSRVRLFDLAISDTDGATDFFMSGGLPETLGADELPEGWDGSGSIHRPKNHAKYIPWCTFDQSIKVQTLRLDSWCEQNGVEQVDFIWADVQGAEGELIRGGTKTLQQTKYIFTEYNNHQLYAGQINLRQILRALPEFEVVHRYQDDVLLRNKALVDESRQAA